MSFPLKMDKILIFENNLSYQDVVYNFRDVKSIDAVLLGFRAGISDKTGLTSAMDLNIRVKFNDEKEVFVTTKTFLKRNEQDFLNFLSGYDYLCRQSFNERHQNFLNQVKTKGYFSYGGAQFYPDGKVISEKNKNKLNIKTCEVKQNKMQTRLTFMPSNIGFIDRIIGKKAVEVIATRDRDVFFAILKVIYGFEISLIY